MFIQMDWPGNLENKPMLSPALEELTKTKKFKGQNSIPKGNFSFEVYYTCHYVNEGCFKI